MSARCAAICSVGSSVNSKCWARDRIVGQHLLRVGGREHEHHVVGRLLEALQQRVGRGVGEHVDLVEDVDLLPAGGAAEGDALEQLAGVVDAAVRCGVELEEVEEGPVGDRLAVRAHTARIAVVAQVQAVERLGQDPRRCGLAGAPRPAEEVRVPDPVVAHRVAQRGGHVILADQLAEPLGSVLPVERLIGHGADARGAPTWQRCPVHRLLLLRHAKSSWADPAIRDHDRPLNDRGRRGRTVIGDHLRAGGSGSPTSCCARRPAAPARRPRPARAPDIGRIVVEHDLYLADPETVLHLIRAVDDRRCDHHGGRPQPDDARGRARPRARRQPARAPALWATKFPTGGARRARPRRRLGRPRARLRHLDRFVTPRDWSARRSMSEGKVRTVHPPSTRPLHAGSRAPAQTRPPCGTRGDPLRAASFRT